MQIALGIEISSFAVAILVYQYCDKVTDLILLTYHGVVVSGVDLH